MSDGFWSGGEEEVAVAGGGDEGHAWGVVEAAEEGVFTGEMAVGGGGDFFYGEEAFGFAGELAAVEAGEAEDDAVGGEDGDAGGVHVDEGHHHGGFGEGRGGEACGDINRGSLHSASLRSR